MTAVKAWWAAARANRLFGLGLMIALFVIALDQISKHMVLYAIRLPARHQIDLSDVFDLTYVENTGVSFGLFSGGMASRVILSVLSVVIAAYVVRWLGTLERRVAAVGAGAIIGGALGNLYDRVFYGYVVDFLDFSGIGFPFVFNIADAAINIGVACLVIDAIFFAPKPVDAKLTKSEDRAGLRSDPKIGTTRGDETEVRGPS